MLNILSSLSAPLTICSGGACNSIYISTVTSILSSFSIPLTLAVPLLNLFGYILQFVGLISLYSANKWRSVAFWMYLIAMVCQMISSHQWFNWICCGLMILASVLNAKSNQFVYGKNKKLFKQSIVWSSSLTGKNLTKQYWFFINFYAVFIFWKIHSPNIN
jgi:hypothetical protein